MKKSTEKFNVSPYHETSELIFTHVNASPGMGGRNIVRAHMENNGVDKKCTRYINEHQWDLTKLPSQKPGYNGPTSSKRSPS